MAGEYFKTTVAPEGKTQFFIVALCGILFILYIFRTALQEQGIPTSINMILFLLLMAMSIVLIGFLISRLSQGGTLTVQEWMIVLFAGAAIVLILVFFNGIVPPEFRSSIMSIKAGGFS